MLPPPFDLALPYLPILAAILIPPGAGLLMLGLVRALGLDAVEIPGLPAARASWLAGLFTLLVASCGVLAQWMLGAADVAEAAAVFVLRGGAAAGCVWIGAWWARAQEGESRRESAAEAAKLKAQIASDRRYALGLSALAALVVLAGGQAALMLVGGAAALAWVLVMGRTGFAPVLRDILRDIAAGIELRERLGALAEVEVSGRVVTVRQTGLLSSTLRDGGELPNRLLLAALPPAPTLPGPGA